MDKVYNPETKRYVKRDSKKGIEILFKNKDKEILKSFELVNGNIIKKCPNGKIRNPKTLRCVNKKVNKKSNSLSRKINAINKIKKAFSPFVKRVSADIYTRVRYLMMMKRELKKVLKDGRGCIRIYKENPDGTFKYRIGHNIILNKRIGSPSVYGEAYLSEFREKSKRLLTFVSKISKFDNVKTPKELEIIELLTNKVRMGKCPHFPITYGKVICEKLNNRKRDGFKKSNSKDKSVEQLIKNYPNVIKKNSTDRIITLFNELANGDLKKFFELYPNNIELIINSLVQIILSIIFYYNYTDMKHNDCHWGNFLFHKIKKGGYFHYKIFDEDFYVENLGFLWVIWDFELSQKFFDKDKPEINFNRSTNSIGDFSTITSFYFPNDRKIREQFIIGQNRYLWKGELNEEKLSFLNILIGFAKIYIYGSQIFELGFNWPKLTEFLINMIKYFKDNHLLLTKIPSGSKIINKEPYVIGKDFLSRY